MEATRRPWLTVAIGLGALLALALTMPRELNLFDEGIILTGAMRVLDGGLVHRDFYSSYGPAQYYAVAAAFQLGPDHFLMARAWDLVVRAGIVANMFWIVSRFTTLRWAVVFAVVASLWLISSGTYLYPIFPCLLLALLATTLLLDVARRPPVAWATFAAGLCVGAAALFRYDVGFFVMIASLIAILAFVMLAGGEGRLVRLLLVVLTFGGGIAAVFLPAAAAFLSHSPLQPFYDDIVDYSVKYYSRMRSLPPPGIDSRLEDTTDLAVYVPFAALVFAALLGAQSLWRSHVSPARASGLSVANACLIAFTALTALLILKGAVRVSPIHMLLALIPSLVIFALATDRLWRGSLVHRAAAGLLVVTIALIPVALEKREIVRGFERPDRSVLSTILARAVAKPTPRVCMRAPGSGSALVDPDLVQVAGFIAARTRPGEPVLSALDRHDKIYINTVALYFAAGRPPATHWYQFDPGLQTRADIQAGMVRELRDGHVNWIARDARFSATAEPNDSARSSGVKILDIYIARNYRPVATFGQTTVWLRNGVEPQLYGSPHTCAGG